MDDALVGQGLAYRIEPYLLENEAYRPEMEILIDWLLPAKATVRAFTVYGAGEFEVAKADREWLVIGVMSGCIRGVCFYDYC